MADERTRYFRRLRRLRRAARRWSVIAGCLGGATVILVPYNGLGLADAAWAATAGGSAVLAGWRWFDLRALVAQSAPPAPDPVVAAERARARLVAVVERLPAGREVLSEVRRQRDRLALRGSAAAAPWLRLDRATMTLDGLAGRLTGPGASAALEAAAADRSLRELAYRVAGVEKALRFAPDDARPHLTEVHRDLVEQLTGGVAAYERLVAAAAGYLAEESRTTGEDVAVSRLTEAADLLRGVSVGLAEMRTVGDPARVPH